MIRCRITVIAAAVAKTVFERGLAMFTRENVDRLRPGMTKEEVEAILGPHAGQNVHHERPQYAWIGEGMMLRVQFFGPGGGLSKALFDTPQTVEVIVPRPDQAADSGTER
jgi:hypothetical protein